MYGVSQTYKDALFSTDIKERRITGLIDGTIPFDQDDILAGSFYYIEKAVGSADINLGGVFIGQEKLTFLKSFSDTIPRGSWRGREIQISIGLKIGANSWEDVPLKPYTIDEADHSATGMTVKAYDAMAKFDKALNVSTTAGKLYDFLALACTACGVTLGMTAAQTEALPNGNETLGIYTNNDMSTWRDLISWIAATAGGFATINRDGALEIRTFKSTSTPDLTIDKYHRFTGASFSDFETYYTGLSVVDIDTGIVQYYGPEDPTQDTGLTMKLGSDPLLQYGTEEAKTRQRRAVLNALSNFNYTPFKATSLIDPAVDLGDVISYTSGIAGTASACCVMAINYQYGKQVQLQGYGKDPATSGAQGKTDKNINGLLSKTSENEVVIHTFMNAAEIALGEDTETDIIKLRFATINPKTVSIFHEIIVETTADQTGGTVTAEVHYYLDTELIAFKPRTSWNNDGPHIIPLMYFLDTLEGGRQYAWEVKLKISGGTATIGRGDARALLQGQGLVATESWDGIIDIEEEYTGAFTGGGTFDYTDAGLEFDWRQNEVITINENYSFSGNGGATFDYTDSCTAYTENILFDLVDAEHENQIGSSDGEYFIRSSE